jgi:hypothetical protein
LLGCSGGSGDLDRLPPELPPPPACEGTGPVSSSRFPIVTEVEPNIDLATAFGVVVPTPTASQSVGLLVLGAVHDSLDQVDTISFTSTRTIEYFVKLCEDSCNSGGPNNKDGNPDSMDTAIAYFDVLNAAGSVIGSTRTNLATENYARLCVAGGVITYLQIVARDTMNAVQEYKITAMEAR